MGRLSESPKILPKPGDICQSCAPYWAKRGKPARYLIAVDQKVTEKKSIPIVCCPWCDGMPILEMNDVETG